ncbi:CatB-related O-acetyltransferase [Acinetobacter celticus]|uniref:CatB-related O-acetyltransferase n=1 Tax=Acinetobacter celticus TaxID=1891224 RepID=UPI00098F5CF7|nr:CatB-related O-acetyltransferase [Acinetobacter celticus]
MKVKSLKRLITRRVRNFEIGESLTISDVNVCDLLKQGCEIRASHISRSCKINFPVHLSPNCEIKELVKIGKFTCVNQNTVIYPHTIIGSYCSIGRDVQVGLAQHPTDWLSSHSFQYNSDKFPNLKEYKDFLRSEKHQYHSPVVIGSDVWIGHGALVLEGVNIETGAIIGAGSVVTKDIPPYAIVGGVPAKIIKYRFDENTISRLLNTKWWEKNPNDLNGVPFHNISEALEILENEKLS